jgi:hypothetical protein
MLERIKNQGFFENRDQILEKAKELNLGKLYIIAPNVSTFLEEDILHVLYSDPQCDPSSSKNIYIFLEALQKEFNLSDIRLHNQEALEEGTVISPGEEGIFRARLSNLIPIEKLSPDILLDEQPVIAIELPSKEELMRRIFSDEGNQKENKNETPCSVVIASDNIEKSPLLTQERKRRSSNDTSEPQTSSDSLKRLRTNTEEEKSRVELSVPISSINQPFSGALFVSSARQERTPLMNELSPEQQEAVRQAVRLLEEEIEKTPGCYDIMLASFEAELKRSRLAQHDQTRVNQVVAN